MKNKFPSEKHYELLAEDFPDIDEDITRSYLEFILIGLPPTKRGNPPLRNKYSKNS